MTTVTVWHGIKHDDATTTDIDIHPSKTVQQQCAYWAQGGGILVDTLEFIPWHKVNYIQVVKA